MCISPVFERLLIAKFDLRSTIYTKRVRQMFLRTALSTLAGANTNGRALLPWRAAVRKGRRSPGKSCRARVRH